MASYRHWFDSFCNFDVHRFCVTSTPSSNVLALIKHSDKSWMNYRGSFHPRDYSTPLLRSNTNIPAVVTAGQTYDELQLSNIAFPPSPDWCFYWRTVRRKAPQEVCGPTPYHVSLLLKMTLNHSTTCSIYTPMQVVSEQQLSTFDNDSQWWRKKTKRLSACVYKVVFVNDIHPGVWCNPVLLSLLCLKHFHLTCRVQTPSRRKRPRCGSINSEQPVCMEFLWRRKRSRCF